MPILKAKNLPTVDSRGSVPKRARLMIRMISRRRRRNSTSLRARSADLAAKTRAAARGGEEDSENHHRCNNDNKKSAQFFAFCLFRRRMEVTDATQADAAPAGSFSRWQVAHRFDRPPRQPHSDSQGCLREAGHSNHSATFCHRRGAGQGAGAPHWRASGITEADV